jgi:uncharacterized metal-binding protein YceD (DUF177 family)
MSFKIDLQELQRRDITVSVDHPSQDFAVDDEDWRLSANVVGDVVFHLVDEEIFAKGTLRAQATGRCVRCLKEMPLELDIPVNYIYQPKETEPQCDVLHENIHEDAAEIAYYTGAILDPLEQIREAILLGLPPLPHCDACEAHRGEPAYVAGPQEAVPEVPEWKRKLRNLEAGG